MSQRGQGEGVPAEETKRNVAIKNGLSTNNALDPEPFPTLTEEEVSPPPQYDGERRGLAETEKKDGNFPRNPKRTPSGHVGSIRQFLD